MCNGSWPLTGPARTGHAPRAPAAPCAGPSGIASTPLMSQPPAENGLWRTDGSHRCHRCRPFDNMVSCPCWHQSHVTARLRFELSPSIRSAQHYVATSTIKLIFDATFDEASPHAQHSDKRLRTARVRLTALSDPCVIRSTATAPCEQVVLSPMFPLVWRFLTIPQGSLLDHWPIMLLHALACH